MKKIIILALAMFMATMSLHAVDASAEPAVVAMEGEVPPMPDDIPAPDLNVTGEEKK